VMCLGLLLESNISWEPDLRWLHVKCRHLLNISMGYFSCYSL
jgi:hypothetical protein